MTSQRHEDARRREEMAAAAARGESEAAQRMIDEFVRQARDRGLPPEPLRATTYGGQSLKTDKQGWYLRRNKSVAIGTDGGYYVLTVPAAGGLAQRWRGIRLEPTPPPLVVGRGGRDGETGDLAEFLARRLGDSASE